MALKHDAGRGNPMPRWPLYILAALALAMAVFALIRFLPDRDIPVKGAVPDTDAPGLEQNNTPDQENVSGDEPQAGPNADVLAEADLLARGYYYDEALALLEGKEGDDIAAKRTEIEGLKAALVPYTGRYYHIFFHSLIIDTDLAFDNIGHSAKGYNEWMTTVSEFQ